MPRRDGTGPDGLGPMTGRGAGLCVLKLPDHPDEPMTGMAGRLGRPVVLPRHRRNELELLRGREQRLTRMLEGLRQHIRQMERRLTAAGIGR